MLDKKIFAEYFTMLCEIYDKMPTDLKMKAYFIVLQEMSNEEFASAIKSILQSRKYASLPKPAEILEYSRPDTEHLAVLAIDDIERAIRRAGAYESVTFEDRVINSIIDHLGGWVKVCQMSESEWMWAKKNIKSLYDTYSKRGNHPQHLIGISENQNSSTNRISVVQAGYAIKKQEVRPALNPSATKTMQKLTEMTNRVRVA